MSQNISTSAEVTGVESLEEQTVQVLEFTLGEETYCLDIDSIDEIVDAGALTPIPNAAPHIEGVMDLRGRTTTIINPNTVFNNGSEGGQHRIIVIDPETTASDSTIGWIVDEVYQVRDVTPEMVDKSATADDDHVIGVVKTDDGFVVWVSPEIATE